MPSNAAIAKDSVGILTPAHRYWRWNVLLSTYFAYMGFYLCRKVYSIAKPDIRVSLGLTYEQIGYIWTAFLVAYMLGQFTTSFLGRKYAPKALLVTGLGLSIVVNVVFGFANNFWTFMVFMIINGFLQSTGWPSSVGAVAHWIRPQERGLVMGVWSTSYAMGTLAVKFVGFLFLTSIGWRWTFGAATLIAVVIWAFLLWRQRDKPEDVGLSPLVIPARGGEADIQEEGGQHLSVAEYFRLAFHPVILTMGLSYLCIKFLRYALDSWLPTFLVTMHLSTSDASLYSMIFDLCGIIPAVLAGWALDRVFKGNWALLCLVSAVGMILGFLIVLQFHASAMAVAVSFGVVGFMVYAPDTILCGAASVQVAGENNGLAVAGLVNGLGSIGPIIQEPIIGWLMDRDKANGMYNTDVMCLILCFVFLFLMSVAAYRRRVVLRRASNRNA